MKLPRLMIAGSGSGCGKTTLFCGMLRLLQGRGLRVAAFKCGPDYIDPLYHREVLGTCSRNLDSFFCGQEELEKELVKGSRDCGIALIEGVMGYYDGLGAGQRTSCSEIAAQTRTPVILVLDASGRSASVLAELQGFLQYGSEGKQIAGVIFNRLSPGLYEELASRARQMGVVPCGYLAKDDRHRFESRHLGLTLPAERADFQQEVDALAARVGATVDMEAVLGIADRAPELARMPSSQGTAAPDVRIALAQDAAFCFYYEQNLEYLESLGCRILPFSPLTDTRVPDCDGLILPGGYPELYAASLSENHSMLESVRRAVSGGLPTIAECGGFLYLHRTLEDQKKDRYAMAGVLAADCRYEGFQRQFGYVNVTMGRDSVLGQAGVQCRGHEFHYYVSDDPGRDTWCEKPYGRRGWHGNLLQGSLYAGFTHLWLPSGPQAAAAFVNACRKGQRIWND